VFGPPGTLLTSVGGEGVIKSCRCHLLATSGTKVVTSLWVPVKNRFWLNVYRLWKKSSFYLLKSTSCNVFIFKYCKCRCSIWCKDVVLLFEQLTKINLGNGCMCVCVRALQSVAWRKTFCEEIFLVVQLTTTTSSWCDTRRRWSMRYCSSTTWLLFYSKCVTCRLSLPSRWRARRTASRGPTRSVSSAFSASLRGVSIVTIATLRRTTRTWRPWRGAALGVWLSLRFVYSANSL